MEKVSIDMQNNESRSSEGGSLVVALMHSRTWAHIAHLSVTGSGSLAMHKALNDYYDSIVGLIDRLVECAQGCYCEILTYPQETAFVAPGAVDKEVLLAYFTALNERVEQDYQGVSQPALQNIMADISELICDTKYKLMFLQ